MATDYRHTQANKLAEARNRGTDLRYQSNATSALTQAITANTAATTQTVKTATPTVTTAQVSIPTQADLAKNPTSNGKAIQAGTNNTATFMPVATAYNTYDSANIKHAEEVNKDGNVLQKIASSVYLGVNNPNVRGSAADWENFIDSKNKYGLKFSQGETANTGDDFKNFWTDVTGKIVTIPSSIQRSVAAGMMASADLITSDINAIKTGNINTILSAKKQNTLAVADAGKAYAGNLKDIATSPTDLTAIGLTAVGTLGLAKAGTKLANTSPRINVNKFNPKTGNFNINTNSGTISINTGKTITLKTGDNTFTVTKGTTTTGAKVLDVVKTNSDGVVTGKIQSIKNTTNTGLKSETDGNLVLNTNTKQIVIQSQNRALGIRTKTGNQVKVTKDSNIGIGFTVDTQKVTSKLGKKQQIIYAKIVKDGNIKLVEKTSAKSRTKTTESSYVQSGSRARIATKTTETKLSRSDTAKNGQGKKRVSKGSKTYTESINADINIGGTAKQLPGNTKKIKGKSAISFSNGEVVIMGNKMGIRNVVSYRLGNSAGKTVTSKAKGMKLVEKQTAKATPTSRTRTGTVIEKERYVKPKKQTKKSANKQETPKPSGTINANKKSGSTTGNNANKKSGGTTNNTNKHGSSNGMMYATKTKGKSHTSSTGNTATFAPLKTVPKQTQKTRITPANAAGTAHVHLSTTKTLPKSGGNTTITLPKSNSTTSTGKTGTTKTSGGTTKTATGSTTTNTTKEDVKQVVKSAVVFAQPAKQTTKQKEELHQKKKSKAVTATNNRRKRRVISLDESKKKKVIIPKSKKAKTAIRLETVNQFGWLGFDSKKAAKARKIKL